jgi:hypothetical protein
MLISCSNLNRLTRSDHRWKGLEQSEPVVNWLRPDPVATGPRTARDRKTRSLPVRLRSFDIVGIQRPVLVRLPPNRVKRPDRTGLLNSTHSFHLGETETGAEFSAHYAGFEDIQRAYADFVKQALSKFPPVHLNILTYDQGTTT